MVSDAVRELADELPEYQSSRGDEFRDVTVDDMERLATRLVIARSQVENASDDAWDDYMFRKSLRTTYGDYLHIAGGLGIDVSEARTIWWSVVYDNPSPIERRQRRLI